VPVDLSRAMVPSCPDCPVFLNRSGRGRTGEIFGWRGAVYPLRLAFDREGSSRISRADSIRFWQAVEAMEADAGLDLFTPATYAEVYADPTNAVLVWEDPTMQGFAGWGSIGADGRGRIGTAAVAIRSFGQISRAGGTGLIVHELVHALGFGHTCAWRSVVAERSRCPGSSTDSLTAEDVAFIQLAAAVHAAAARVGAASPWDEALRALQAEPREGSPVAP
jgi:hypothetical protein